MTDEEKTAALESYLRGGMSPAEREEFRRLLQNDPALQAELALHQELEAALGPSPLNELRDTVATVLRENRPGTGRARRLVYWLLAALLLLGLLLVWRILKSPEQLPPAQLFARYFQPPAELQPAAQLRSENDREPDPDQRIDSLYRAKNYPAALKLLEAQSERPGFQASSTYHYQLSILYLANRESEPALRNLDQIEVGYGYEKQWYRALALLLGAGNAAQTRSALQQIANSESPFRQDAAALLRDLKE